MRTLVLLLGVAATAGCGGKVIVVNGIEVYESHWNRAVDAIAPRAAHDMNCSREEMQFALFQKTGREPVQVGVVGCGRRATYTRPTARGPGGRAIADSWILDGSVQ